MLLVIPSGLLKETANMKIMSCTLSYSSLQMLSVLVFNHMDVIVVCIWNKRTRTQFLKL